MYGTKNDNPLTPKKSYLPIWEYPTPKTTTVFSSELDMYLKEEPISADIRVLDFWKANSRFPILSRIARDYLAASPVGTPTERMFSKTGKLLRPERSRMSASYARERFLLAEWIRFFGPMKPQSSCGDNNTPSEKEVVELE